MADWKYDVVIVGAGPAGITAAIALAKAQIPVLVLEAGKFPGAENWSGAVYFTENLAQPDVLGEEAVRASAWERPVTKRGIHLYNGHTLVGLTYHNPDTFRHCYTVLRPTYDHYLAELAKSFGATILTETTATGLLRDSAGKVIGVHTTRGPIYAAVVFLAEGDASHLVTKEGYERCPNNTPHFLQGIKEVIELDPAEIESRFALPPGEGAAYEIILRNPGKLQLNMGGFIYTNHSSLSLGLVMPLDNLAREFKGDHNRLMEWFKSLPEIQRLTGGGRAVAYGAKLIRGGGFRELPQLVDHGLALGGACTGIGLDFPFPNYTGPATAMGRLFAQAVRQAHGDFRREHLTELYEKPLRQTHYFQNVEFLQDWPHYVAHTRVFFGRAADLACGALHIATHPDLRPGQKLWQQAKFLRETLPPKRWGEFFRDLRQQRAALGLQRAGSSRAPALRHAGAVSISINGQPRFQKLASRLRSACDHPYRNDDTPLPVKLRHALRSAPRPWSLGGWPFLTALLAPFQWLCEMIGLLVTRPSPEKYLSSFYQRTLALVRQRANLDAVPLAQPIEEKLSLIRYSSEKTSHIKVQRPEHFEDRRKLADSPLWHVCPAKVYEQHTDDLGQVQIVVHFENCIKCETCWRAAPADVDWTRHREQRLVFSSPTPANRKLLAVLNSGMVGAASPPRQVPESRRGRRSHEKLQQFCTSIHSGPRYLDTGRRQWLLSLLEDSGCDRALAYAKAGKFFWAEAEVQKHLAPSPSVFLSEAKDLTTESGIEHHFTKQSIKDLERGARLTADQLAFLKSLQPTPDILRALAARDVSLALLVSGIAHAQITARPDLADVEWIGLNTARRHAREFPVALTADCRAIVRGAGEMLLERCRQHARSRVQFPGLFQDEDAHDGIAKFGAVKQMLSEMEAQVWQLRHNAANPREAFFTLAYNAGQIIGGSAYSEDDIFSKFYRDSVVFSRLLFDDEEPSAGAPTLASEPQTELDFEIIKLLKTKTWAQPQRRDLAELGSTVLTRGYLLEQPLQSPPPFSYRSELAQPNPYDYGDFLTKPFDPVTWRYVPEMLHADPELRAYHDQLYRHFTERYVYRPGEKYYRLVERLHQVPLADVHDMVAHGFTRMYIPKEFGGAGLLKAHYYILCPLSMRYADPSYALTIMAHSSIGTTPILLGLNQDLPRAEADLQEFLAAAGLIQNLKSTIHNLLRMLESPAALKVKDAFTALGKKVKTDIGKKPMLRAIASEFLTHFMDAGRAGLRMDLPKFKAELQACGPALDTVRPRAEMVIAELDRRAEAAKFFLRLISAGQISAFALTEPSAGSDSGGIQTRAELKRAEVFTNSDGSKYFRLGTERRGIVDAATVDIANLPDADIAQIRKEGGREFYEYYELNGAKMWITNGHVAGVFCLYARTKEGPTGFLVRRNSEGLKVGRDEEKMGQRGSPTNELSLNGVRVPRENIIGIEGRGQVNALETLNVGRTGLCVSAAAMTAKIIEQTRQFVRERGLENEPHIQQLVGEMTIEHYATESLAYELIGRFDHHDTKSVRTESAIGKYYASEVLHRVIRAAENIYGLEGGTQLHELEKHRRDARVLNIYEGTNEVQRFLILRDLVDKALPNAKESSPLIDRLRQAVETFGQQVWQNANFQPAMFKLAEMAGYLKAMDSARWRTQWLTKNTTAVDSPHRQLAEVAYDRYCDCAQREIQRLLSEFDRDCALLKQGLYPPEIRVAMLALQEAEHKPALAPQPAILPPAQHIVVVANVVPALSPRPRVVEGELLETHFELDVGVPTSLSRRPVRLTILTVAPRYAAELLRRALAAGATDAVLLEADDLPEDIHATARLIADHIAVHLPSCDLVLCGEALFCTILNSNLGGLPPVRAITEATAANNFSVDDFCAAQSKPLEIIPSAQIIASAKFPSRLILPAVTAGEQPTVATPAAAAKLVRALTGVESSGPDGDAQYTGKIEAADQSVVPARAAAVFVATPGNCDGAETAAECAAALGLPFHVVVVGDPDEKQIRELAGRLAAASVFFCTHAQLRDDSPEGVLAAAQYLWKDTLPSLLASGTWANEVFAQFASTFPRVQARYNVAAIAHHELAVPVFGGNVHRVFAIGNVQEHPLVATFTAGSQHKTVAPKRVCRVPLDLEYVPPPKQAEARARSLMMADADVIIDVGYAIRNRENFDLIVLPLKDRLEKIGVQNVMIGGTRKVVEDLKLLTPDRQIGQTGTAVNPKLIISLGVSGAPQHVDYLGERALIIAFNKDADAPLLTLNQRRARPKVIPLVGDLYELVPEFTKAL